jgi:hypothetical protein
MLLTLWMESATHAAKISAIKTATIPTGLFKYVGRLQSTSSCYWLKILKINYCICNIYRVIHERGISEFLFTATHYTLQQ